MSRHVTIPWSDSFSAVLIGFFGNLIFPLRLGDATRVALISLKHRLNFGFTLATGVLDKLLDVITLVIFAGVVTTSIVAPEIAVRAIQSATAVAGLAVVTLIVLAVSRNGVAWLDSMLAKFVPRRFTTRMLNIAEMFVTGLQSLKDARQMVKAGYGRFLFTKRTVVEVRRIIPLSSQHGTEVSGSESAARNIMRFKYKRHPGKRRKRRRSQIQRIRYVGSAPPSSNDRAQIEVRSLNSVCRLDRSNRKSVVHAVARPESHGGIV
jgi:hypothetical protein